MMLAIPTPTQYRTTMNHIQPNTTDLRLNMRLIPIRKNNTMMDIQ